MLIATAIRVRISKVSDVMRPSAPRLCHEAASSSATDDLYGPFASLRTQFTVSSTKRGIDRYHLHGVKSPCTDFSFAILSICLMLLLMPFQWYGMVGSQLERRARDPPSTLILPHIGLQNHAFNKHLRMHLTI